MNAGGITRGVWIAPIAVVAGCLDWSALSQGTDAQAAQSQCAAFVVAGDTHTCARFTNGSVQCWGDNRFGQLGSGDTTATREFVSVKITNGVSRLYLPAGIGDISADRAVFTCALETNATLSCWGDNRFGQLGVGTTEPHASPKPVPTLPATLRAALGAGHVCAQAVAGEVYCWGTNDYGQAGNAGTQLLSPSRLDGLSEPIDGLVAGAYHTCAKATSGALYCWGANDRGQLGNIGVTKTPTPIRVPGVDSIVKVVAGAEHTCIVNATGQLSCFGDNRYGQLGAGDTSVHDTPVVVPLPEAVLQVYPGRTGTCALVTSRVLYCWGGNANGELGTGTRDPVPLPSKAHPDTLAGGVAAASLGGAHACAVRADGATFCWGSSQYGQLGPNGNAAGVTAASVFPSCNAKD